MTIQDNQEEEENNEDAGLDDILDNDEEDGEEITINKAEYEKIKSDRDNYRAGLLKKKADERSMEMDKTKEVDKEKAKVKDESSSVFSEIHKSNESRAKRQLIQKYGELADDVNWQGFMSHFTGKRGKITVEDIMDDFEDTMLLYKRSTGQLENYLKLERERGVKEGRIQRDLEMGLGGVGAGDKNVSNRKALSPSGERMAKAMHVDPEKVKKIDISKDNVINEV